MVCQAFQARTGAYVLVTQDALTGLGPLAWYTASESSADIGLHSLGGVFYFHGV